MNVEHDVDGRRFVVRAGGEDAELAYAIPRKGVMDLLHTYVPPAARDQGVADALASAAFAYARRNAQRIVPTCAFVQGWLRGHPEQRDLVER
ncbi:MAG: GCN5-related N-acetyltransferase [Gemmatimonadetes bacterium]|nr:GCN5-related N-acetyltransferase [Gemmatimonadota bacterium]